MPTILITDLTSNLGIINGDPIFQGGRVGKAEKERGQKVDKKRTQSCLPLLLTKVVHIVTLWYKIF